MPLTPADVHKVAFNKPPIGKRGYNEDEVDQFLDLVEDTLAQLLDENDDLRAQVEELSRGGATQAPSAPVAATPQVDEKALRADIEAEIRAEYEQKVRAAEAEARSAREDAERARKQAGEAGSNRSQPSTVAATAAPKAEASADTHVQAAKVLGLAQEMADRLTSDAQAEARSMLDEARGAAERQLQEAESKANETTRAAESRALQLVSEAEKRADETTNDANSRAEAQVRQAEEKAQKLQADAERKHTEIMNTVKQQQAALENRIAELRTFEREYRTRLKTLLQSQLEELESRSTSAPSGDAGEK
ncbi:DivIVA domain-containing protein [Corynebacterium sanguinis]|uniref:Cell wall synthesis protein Wag31 n=1 Tax=Corynebacterium sanguinis TaxID=2594913 RepID=A0A6C1U0M5_9CORY|nr:MULTISPECIES: DivIVA domain-containing protein [Corynebacterium]MCT1413204.1 DivIVA domain-containing protein [Corynebacterium sanguinis]MCT1462722.1 DivIVA domain-containing protein [Corynebacterium sanguinis]MCT1881757.1 DivIVA domain-containing protein [Corynebacterium sanguinis]MCT2328972.1 DivIVA domain-containing protein [Corynebacterium sanguinis]TVS24391.1 DivIVA domain-containing protein [Corynebacterium sanguinis]